MNREFFSSNFFNVPIFLFKFHEYFLFICEKFLFFPKKEKSKRTKEGEKERERSSYLDEWSWMRRRYVSIEEETRRKRRGKTVEKVSSR